MASRFFSHLGHLPGQRHLQGIGDGVRRIGGHHERPVTHPRGLQSGGGGDRGLAHPALPGIDDDPQPFTEHLPTAVNLLEGYGNVHGRSIKRTLKKREVRSQMES